jgi:hypothetical protein
VRKDTYLRVSPELEYSFPGLTAGSYKLTSPKDGKYNCVAWAVGDIRRYWDDVRYKGRRIKGYYWPDGISADTVDGWKAVFTLHGYSECESEAFDADFEKVAIYVYPNGDPSHVTRQMGSGKWSCKLGVSFDIEHETLDSLKGEEYGTVGVIMQRRCKDGNRVALP